MYKRQRIEGIKTTVPLHKKILEDERFLQGRTFTNFLDSLQL